ncbi:MAG: hypothetical protein WDW36_001664 [Sanguina aurantia]
MELKAGRTRYRLAVVTQAAVVGALKGAKYVNVTLTVSTGERRGALDGAREGVGSALAMTRHGQRAGLTTLEGTLEGVSNAQPATAELQAWLMNGGEASMTQINTLLARRLSAAQVLLDLAPFSGCWVVAVMTGGVQPQRRNSSTPFLSVDSGAEALLKLQPLVNSAAAVLEAARGRRLYPLTVKTSAFGINDASGQGFGEGRPYAIYDVSRGEVLLKEACWQQPTDGDGMFLETLGLVAATVQLFVNNIATQLKALGDQSLLHVGSLQALLAPAATIAIAGAFAGGPPLWFCILCPTLLGLLAPLAINFGLGGAAGQVCQRLALDDDACFDLFLGALGLGMVLSLASAVPIFFVCRLQQCARGTNATALFR